METNEHVVITDEDTKEDDFTPEVIADETTDWKAKAAELKGIAKRRATQLKKAKEALTAFGEKKPEVPKPTPQDKPSDGELDLGKKAYLRASGIEPTEFSFVNEELKTSGESDVEKLMSNPYFQARLKEKREAIAIARATPDGSKRGGGEVATSKVDYWLAKNEMPPNTPENVQLRRDYVNAKELRSKTSGTTPFYNSPR